MEKYLNDSTWKRMTHVIRVDFQFLEYKGHIVYEANGNCYGANLFDTFDLDCMNQEDIDQFIENSCQFRFNEDEEVFSMNLITDSGDELEIAGDDAREVRNMIIGMQILDCRPIGKKE